MAIAANYLLVIHISTPALASMTGGDPWLFGLTVVPCHFLWGAVLCVTLFRRLQTT